MLSDKVWRASVLLDRVSALGRLGRTDAGLVRAINELLRVRTGEYRVRITHSVGEGVTVFCYDTTTLPTLFCRTARTIHETNSAGHVLRTTKLNGTVREL